MTQYIVKNMDALQWASLVRIDSRWINKFLIAYDDSLERKVKTRAFSIRFSGNHEHMQALIEFMANKIIEFTLSEAEIKELKTKGKVPWREAAKSFGSADPKREGKFGELLLFLLVEAILKTPMIAHKIKSLSDPKDQIKGSDGAFFGSYNNTYSLLLGEAKVYKNRNQAITDALKSVDKFYNAASAGQEMKTELFVIKQTITTDLSPEQLNFLLKVLDTQTEEYQKVNKVHPILIVYDEGKIPWIEKNCQCKDEGEKMAYSEFKQLAEEILPQIAKKNQKKLARIRESLLGFFLYSSQ